MIVDINSAKTSKTSHPAIKIDKREYYPAIDVKNDDDCITSPDALRILPAAAGCIEIG